MKKSIDFEFTNTKLTTYSRLTQDQARKRVHIYGYNNDVHGYNNFQLFHLAKITRNYYTPVTFYHVISVII